MQQQWDGSLADEHKIQSSPCPKISNTKSQPVNQSPHLLLALVYKKDLILYIRDIRKANQESTLMLSPQCVFFKGWVQAKSSNFNLPLQKFRIHRNSGLFLYEDRKLTLTFGSRARLRVTSLKRGVSDWRTPSHSFADAPVLPFLWK